LAATHDLPRANSEFQKAVGLEPHSVEYYILLGALYLCRANPTRRKAVDNNPQSSQLTPWPSTKRRRVKMSRRQWHRGPQARWIRAGFNPAAPLGAYLRLYWEILGLFYLSTGEREKAIAVANLVELLPAPIERRKLRR
jgi:hypothetical protein